MENELFKWHIYGPTYTKSGICFALSEEGVKIQLRNKGFVAADNAVIQKIDTSCPIHVITDTSFHTDAGCC